MENDRRQFLRGPISGVALIYDSKIEPTELIDVGIGGMRVSGKFTFSIHEPVWIEFTFVRDAEMVWGKRARATLRRSEYDQSKKRFIMGFEFLSLTEFQQYVIANAIG